MPVLRAEGGGQSGGLKVRGWGHWGGWDFCFTTPCLVAVAESWEEARGAGEVRAGRFPHSK